MNSEDICREFELDGRCLVKYNGTETRVEVQEGIEKIGDEAFANNTRLIEVILPESLREIGDHAFDGCTELLHISIPEGVRHIGKAAFKCCRCIERITVPEGITKLESSTFESCSDLRDVTLPLSLREIDDNAFKLCRVLRGFCIPRKVERIGENAFMHCRELGDSGTLESLREIGSNAFCYCLSLKRLVLPSTVRAIADSAFIGCFSLTVETEGFDHYYRVTICHPIIAGYIKMLREGKEMSSIHRRCCLEFVCRYPDQSSYTTDIGGETLGEALRAAIMERGGIDTLLEVNTIMGYGIYSQDAEVMAVLIECKNRLGGEDDSSLLL